MNTSLNNAVNLYSELGFDTIPLHPGNKNPLSNTWQLKEPHRQWANTPTYANVGIRGGGMARIAIIDCDEKDKPGTFDTAKNWLNGLGFLKGSYPVIQTASGVGRHIYISFAGNLNGDWRKLHSDFGAGEFRYGSGAYVVAPPSIVNENSAYTLVSGDFRFIPELKILYRTNEVKDQS